MNDESLRHGALAAAAPPPTLPALKEWAACEEALTAGATIVLLRKGGIREPTRSFRLDQPAFGLFPTYEHQRADLLKPEAEPYFDASLAHAGEHGTVRIRLWLAATDVYEVRDPARLAALDHLHIWSHRYAAERLSWRPTQPLLVVLVRAWRLRRELAMPMQPAWSGCTSWVALPRAPSLELGEPVVSAEVFQAMAEPLRALLDGLPHVAHCVDLPAI